MGFGNRPHPQPPPPTFTFPSEIHIHVHSDHADHESAKSAILAALQEFEDRVMAKFDTVVALQTAVNDATNQVAANIQLLIDKINATPGDGLDGPQTEAVIAHLTALETNLKAMAASSSHPIPPPVEPPPTL
jgi:uncharacterized protein involved in exopolysaccharide biosynthesis